MTSTKKEHSSEKHRLGWSHIFHKGGDLNQILGILSEYKSIPINFRKLIKKIVIKHDNEFPYAITKGNKYTNAKYLLNSFDKLFKL